MESAHGGLRGELEEMLGQMEEGLALASEAARRLQDLAPRVAALEEVLSSVEDALSGARERATAPARRIERPHSVVVPAGEPAAGEDAETGEPDAPADEQATPAPGEETPEAPALAAVAHDDSRCYVLSVESVGGALDLRTVDQPIAENPQVADVALLDYDGRKASLKIWLNEDGDPNLVRDELENKLRAGGGWCVISLSEQAAA